MKLKNIFKTRMLPNQVCRREISKKLDFEIKRYKEILEQEFKKKYGMKRTISLCVVSDLIAEKIRLERYKNGG